MENWSVKTLTCKIIRYCNYIMPTRSLLQEQKISRSFNKQKQYLEFKYRSNDDWIYQLDIVPTHVVVLITGV